VAQEIILFVQGIELPPDVLELSHALLPQGFELRTVPARARSSEIAEAMRPVNYVYWAFFFISRTMLISTRTTSS
jgi:hypothetical protein